MVIQLVGALALLVANGFFVASEFALTRLRPTQVDEMDRQGRAGAKAVRHGVEHIDAYLSACQLGITAASLGLGVLGERAFRDLLSPVLGEGTLIVSVPLASLVAFLIITTLHVVVGELAPKSLAIARNEGTSLAVAPPMRAFYLVTKPVVDVFNGMGNLLLKPFGIPPAREAGHAPHTEDELRGLMRQSAQEGLIEGAERDLGERVFSFGDRRIREIMVPRAEVDFLTVGASVEQAASKAASTGHTRLPVCEETGELDTAVGLLNAKDLLTGEGRDLEKLARPLRRVADGTLLDELLRTLRRERQHLALVVDEHGTAVGIVTLEDVLEEIVGEIEDEFDPRAVEPVVREDGAVLIQAAASPREVAEALELDMGNVHEATFGGHLMEVLGRLPEQGEVIDLDEHRFEVTEVDEARIIRLRLAGDPSQPQEDDEDRGRMP